jgi:histidyl-tRNA synthetase
VIEIYALAPEYTAIVQDLAKTYFKPYKNVKLFYVQECFRGEKPQAGDIDSLHN